MSGAIQTILNHRSIRSFTDQPLTEQQIKELVSAAQAASSASFQQSYSIIGVSDESVREEIRTCSGGQEFIVKSGHFFVFCADLYRHKEIATKLGIDISQTIEGIDALMLGAIDASLAAQNMAIAAESMGLGVCYVGGVRDGVISVSASLGLPDYVLPVFGLAVGYPEEINEKKPRLPFETIYHKNHYDMDKNKLFAQLAQYDQTMESYFGQRTTNKRQITWTDHSINSLLAHPRTFMKDFVTQKGWAKH